MVRVVIGWLLEARFRAWIKQVESFSEKKLRVGTRPRNGTGRLGLGIVRCLGLE